MNKEFGLSQEELDRFRRDGYIGPFELYDMEEMKETYKKLRAEMFDRECAIYKIDHTSLLAGYDRHLDIEFFGKHIMKKQILHKLEDILGPDVLCWRSELFPKYPGNEGTDWHQADTFAHASGAPQIVWPSSEFGGAVTVWTAVTEASEEMGCLRFIPGTHEEMFYDESKDMAYKPDEVDKLEKDGIRRGFFGYDYRNLQKDPHFKPDESAAVSVEMKAGEFVIFWSTLMHSSLPNTTTNRTRLGFTARYVPTCVRVYPGTDTVDEYNTVLSLKDYGTVLVSGADHFGHNRILASNTRGMKFAQS